MKLVDADTINRLLSYPELIAALRQSHQGKAPESAHLLRDEPDNGGNQFVALVGWQRDDIIAVKLVGIFPGNLSLTPSQPSVQGVVVTFDAATGTPKMIADGAQMTFRKTAGVSGLGSSILARKDAQTLLIVGAGGLAPHVLMAHCAARPSINKVMIWNRTFERAEALAAQYSTSELQVTAVSDLDAATAEADIISCVTMSDTPLIRGDCLKAGTHLDLIGAYRQDMREADNAAMIKGRIFVDTRNGMEGAGDLHQPVEAGLITWDAVNADLFQLCQGKNSGRNSEDEITVFKNVGGGHLDLFTASHLQQLI